ncbi:MAG TPA: riboflavin synthase [Candidatus Bilamarchaeum sp.]|nr:riboflavin synthase [Candidatus Bilamarchaeum sp.]
MKIGIVDTTFSRVDMGQIALDELKSAKGIETERRTVPGIKDLAVECKRMLDAGCGIAMALGMVGGAPIDTQCAHEASLGIQQAKLMTGRHIIEVFVHENEAWSEAEFREICDNRIRKHAHNAVALLTKPESLTANAGRGIRQGRGDEGPAEGEQGLRIAIVTASFNGEITSRMRKRAAEAAKKGGAQIVLVDVPGVFDIPLVMKKMLMDKKIHAGVALGAVVKGDTAHDEVITRETANRLAGLSLEFGKPVTLGIIGHGASWGKAEERAESYAEHSTASAISLVRTLRGRS